MTSEILQYITNGLIVGALIALPSLGLTLIFSVLGFINFSVAAQMTVGAYAGWLVNTRLQWPLVPVLIVAFIVAGALGVVTDRVALSPMRERRNTHTALMLAIVSIAVNMALENVLRFTFGSGLQSYDMPVARDMLIGGVRIGFQQLNNLGIALVLGMTLALFFTLTRMGKAMRAVADNVDLARLKGIDPQRLATLATFIGMGLAGIGGALLAVDTSVDPSTGSRLILTIFAASVLGGLTSLSGAVVGALVIGVVGELGLFVLPPVYQSVTAFAIILITLLVLPGGFFAGATGVRR
jgi:branched-chain amino acid transport system permease protein